MMQLTWEQFFQEYDSEQACAEQLFHIKWPNGFSCMNCGHGHASKTSTRRLPLYECHYCGYQNSLTVGTIMEGSRTPLRKWFTAFFMLSRTDCGTSAMELSRVIRVTYKTAWLMLHKIRNAMSEKDAMNLLTGTVMVQSAVYGRPYNPSVYRHAQENPLLVGASLDTNGQAAQLKMKLVHKKNLLNKHILRSGTEVFAGQHVDLTESNLFVAAGRYDRNRSGLLNTLFTKLRLWINSTFHGLGRKHLQAYLDEFCFRHNLTCRRDSHFNETIHLCCNAPRITYDRLISRIAS